MSGRGVLRILVAIVCCAVLVAAPAGCGEDEGTEDTATTSDVGADEPTTNGATGASAATDADDATAAGGATETNDLQVGASDRFVGTWVDMQGNVGPFQEFTLSEDGSAVVIDRDGNELQALWKVEEIGQGSWYELEIEAQDGQKLDNAVEWVSETEFKRKNADGSWVKQ